MSGRFFSTRSYLPSVPLELLLIWISRIYATPDDDDDGDETEKDTS